MPRLIHTAYAIIGGTRARFGGLTTDQLNWKPSVEQWSVAQCYDHLVTANTAYFPTFETISSGEKVSTFWERLIRFMEATKEMDPERIIISSPVTGLITYSLMDTYRMLIGHERRHIRQATRVREMVGFPG